METSRVDAALEALAAGRTRDALRSLEAARRDALQARDVETLRAVDAIARDVAERNRGNLRGAKAADIAWACGQNLAFLGAAVAEAAGPADALVRAAGSVEEALGVLRAEQPDTRSLRAAASILRAAAAEIDAVAAARAATPVTVTAPAPAAPPRDPAPPAPPAAARVRRSLDDLGPALFAWAGGLVLLLGVVLLFAFAARAGWIGSAARLCIGAVASLAALGAGAIVRRRSTITLASLAATGAGLAGLYAVIVAASAVYDFVGALPALALAAAVAATGGVLALRWREQIVAALALLGAMALPLVDLVGGGRSALGGAFVAVVLVAVLLVGLRRGWPRLVAGGALLSVAELALLAARVRHDDAPVGPSLAVALAVAAILLLGGLACRLRSDAVDRLGAALVLWSAAVAVGATVVLLGDGAGGPLLGAAGLYAALGFVLRGRCADLTSVLGIAATAVSAVGLATLLDDATLTLAFAAQACAVAWVGRRLDAWALRVTALVDLAVGIGYLLIVDARPWTLFEEHGAHGHAALAALAAAAGAGLVAVLAEAREELSLPGGLSPLVLLPRQGLTWIAGALGLHALTLGAVALTVEAGGSFAQGHVVVTLALAAGGLALTAVRRERPVAGGIVLAAAAVLALSYDAWLLGRTLEAAAATAVAAALAAAAFMVPGEWVDVTLGAAAGLVPVDALTGVLGRRDSGWPLAVEAGALGAVTALALARGRRAAATGLGGSGVLVGAFAASLLLDRTWVVVAGAVAAGALALAARAAREPRLEIAAGAVLAASALAALYGDATPEVLYRSGLPAGAGAAEVAGLVAAALVAAATRTVWRVAWLAAAGAGAVYAASLGLVAVLGLADGHVALTALWAQTPLAVARALRRRAEIDSQLADAPLVVVPMLAVAVAAHDLDAWGAGRAAVSIGLLALACLAATRLAATEAAATLAGGIGPALAAAAIGIGTDGSAEGAALLAAAAVYGALAVADWRIGRDGLVPAGALPGLASTGLFLAGTAELLPRPALVPVWAGAALALAAADRRFRDGGLQAAGALVAAVATVGALAGYASPAHLFVADANPGRGVPEIVACVLAWLALRPRLGARLGEGSAWVGALVGLYAVALSELQLVQWIGGGSVDSRFQRGHTVVTGSWAAVALVVLVTGLARRRRLPQAVGAGLFAVALAKLFFYDLPSLSAVARAASFLAVGALLLIAAHLIQRLGRPRDG